MSKSVLFGAYKTEKNMTKPVAFYANLVYNVHKDIVVAARVKKYTF